MNRKAIAYTSTLPSVVMEELTEYAKKIKTSKNKVIEGAIVHFLEGEKKKRYEQGFKRIASDTETSVIAEEGAADYANQLKKY
jgi:flagellar motor switch protein FliG